MPRPSPSRDRILRHLLGASAKGVPVPDAYRAPFRSIYELAQRTGVAFSWVHATVREIEAAGWLRVGDHLQVVRPGELYEWWQGVRTRPRVHGFHVQDPREAGLALLHEHGLPVAFTSYYAENAYQGHLFPRRGDLYLRLEDLARAREIVVHRLGGQLGGTNFRLLAGDDALLEERVRIGDGPTGIDYAPLPQVVLDLIAERGSAREAADMLIQKAHPHARARLR